MKMRPYLSDAKWSLPGGVALGALLAVFQRDFYLTAWWSFSLAGFVVLWSLAAAWRWAGGGRRLAVIMVAALAARLAAGVALTVLLPTYGYDEVQQRAGYVFNDAFRRDSEAWALAQSGLPIWSAIGSDVYTSDQYGGLFVVSAALYRALSPDVHRQMLVILLAAWAGALAIPFAFRAFGMQWSNQTGFVAAWVLALYPESVLLGGSQMREPFLVVFICIALWGLVEWLAGHVRRAWIWFAFGMSGLLAFSPGIALAALLVFGGWMFAAGNRSRAVWRVYAVVGALFLLGLFILLPVLAQSVQGSQGAGPVGVLWGWLNLAAQWDFHLLERSSGIVQYMLESLPSALHMPFIVGYGVTQPLLPAALTEPAAVIWKVVGIVRAGGWYMLLPFLVYGIFAAFATHDIRQRNILLWLVLMDWLWILLVSMRAGADQWDNPRYRAIFLPFMALIAAAAWQTWQEKRDRWLYRIIGVEFSFLIPILLWYAGRYYSIPKTSLFVYFAVILVLAIGVVVGDIFLIRWRANRRS